MDELHRNRSGWITHDVAGLFSLAPLLLAFFFTQRVPSGPAVPEPPIREPIAFAQYSLNLREVPLEPIVTAHFDFWNRGQGPVSVTRLEPSCACLNPKLFEDKKSYRPGERGRFYVQVRTANESPGPHEYAVRMLYEYQGKSISRFVTFRLTLPERKISIEPPQLVFYHLGSLPEPQRVNVTDYRGNPIQVISAEITGDWAEAVVEDRELDEKGQVRVPVRVGLRDGIAPGKHLEVLKIRTNDPDFGVLSVPVIVFGATHRVSLANGEEVSSSETVKAVHTNLETEALPPANGPAAGATRPLSENHQPDP